MQWIRYFLTRGFRVVLSSPSKLKPREDWGHVDFPPEVELRPLELNRAEPWRALLQELQPTLVLFDRFILEEQFGAEVYATCPRATTWLETQDLHSLRKLRQSGVEADTSLRELASIRRVDHAFVVSSFEYELVTSEWEVPREQVTWLPLLPDTALSGEFPKAEALKPWSDRQGFCFVGNFRHAPNLDGLRWFRGEVWPRLRIRFPSAQVHLYGAYPPEEVMSWNKPHDGFRVHGPCDSVAHVFASARVNLAPLRFGAGVKGKVIEAMAQGLPTVTTEVGVEGIYARSEYAQSPSELFPGLIANSAQNFAEACIALHEDSTLWVRMQKRALEQQSRFEIGRSEKIIDEVRARTRTSMTSRMLRHELTQSHKYFARWIEAKRGGV
jgi:hypothetical protein